MELSTQLFAMLSMIVLAYLYNNIWSLVVGTMIRAR